MYKKIHLLFLIFLMLLTAQSIAKENNDQSVYIAQMRAKGLSFNMYINGISLGDNLSYNLYQQMSKSDRIGYALSEGNNVISLQVIDTFEREGAFAEVTIMRSLYDEQTQKNQMEEVTSIRVTVGADGKFTTQESKTYPNSNLTGQVSLVELDNSSYTDEGLLKDIIASRTLVVNHPHKSHSWSYRSTPVENNPETFQKAWNKYMKLRDAVASKDFDKYVASRQPGIGETEKYQGDPTTLSWTKSIIEPLTMYAWKSPDFMLLPVDPNDYELQVTAGGRLFRINEKDSLFKDQSPILYQSNGNNLIVNPTLTLINGKVVEAW